MRVGDSVLHATFGAGIVEGLRMGGQEVIVQFGGRLRMVCLPRELRMTAAPRSGDAAPNIKPTVEESKPVPRLRKAGGVDPLVGVIRKRTMSVAESTGQAVVVEARDRFKSKQAVEALRFGVVPASLVDELTVGLSFERSLIRTALQDAQRKGGEALAVVGDYGAGKSHLLEWTVAEALRRNFLVATASLDLHEVPPNEPRRIYNALINSIRYPDRSDHGSLAPLFDQLVASKDIADIVKKIRREDVTCPLYCALGAYWRRQEQGNPWAKEEILRWIASDRVMPDDIRRATDGLAVRPLRTFSTVADLYCYLLSGMSWLAQQAGYSGLVVLLDESEHYSLLSTTQRLRADAFFHGMVYSALGGRQTKIPGCARVHGPRCYLAHGGHEPFPFRFESKTGLAFFFAVTPSLGSDIMGSWLDRDRVLSLDQVLSLDDVVDLITRIHTMHAQAYECARRVSIAEVLFELLRAYENGRVSLRSLIKHVTNTCDLLRAYPDLNPQSLQSEVKRAFA